MVGIIVGCYSSIFVCSPLYYDLCKSGEESKYTKQIKSKNKKEIKIRSSTGVLFDGKQRRIFTGIAEYKL